MPKTKTGADGFERYVAQGERLLGVPADALRPALLALRAAFAPRPLEGSLDAARRYFADPVHQVLAGALSPFGWEIGATYDGRPRVFDILVTKATLFGEGAVNQNLALDPEMAGRRLHPGDRLRMAVFRAEERHGGLALFTMVPPVLEPTPPWNIAAFVLMSEARVWVAPVEETISIRKQTRKGETYGRVRRMADGRTLRWEFAQGPSDYDLDMRLALVDETRRRKDEP